MGEWGVGRCDHISLLPRCLSGIVIPSVRLLRLLGQGDRPPLTEKSDKVSEEVVTFCLAHTQLLSIGVDDL
jgi:hypothetical protein